MVEANWPKGTRRDCEPHRGELPRLVGRLTSLTAFFATTVITCAFFLLRLGRAGTVLAGLVFPFAVLSLFCLILGIILGHMARRDPAGMQAGAVDLAGEAPTAAAQKAASSAIVQSCAGLLLYGAVVLVVVVLIRP